MWAYLPTHDRLVGQRAPRKIPGPIMSRARALQLALLVGTVLITGKPDAATIVFDFEDQAATSGPSDGDLAFLVMSSMGLEVRLSRTSGAPFDIFDTSVSARFPADWGDRALDPFADVSRVDDRWLMEFSQPIQSFSIQFGDFGGDRARAGAPVRVALRARARRDRFEPRTTTAGARDVVKHSDASSYARGARRSTNRARFCPREDSCA